MAKQSPNGLMLAGRPAAFRELTALAAIDHAEEIIDAEAALLTRYPALDGLKGAEFTSHPQRNRYLLEHQLYAVHIPALRAAWAGEGAAPTADEIATSPQANVLPCVYEVRRLNPYLTDLPAPPEDDRPNE